MRMCLPTTGVIDADIAYCGGDQSLGMTRSRNLVTPAPQPAERILKCILRVIPGSRYAAPQPESETYSLES